MHVLINNSAKWSLLFMFFGILFLWEYQLRVSCRSLFEIQPWKVVHATMASHTKNAGWVAVVVGRTRISLCVRGRIVVLNFSFRARGMFGWTVSTQTAAWSEFQIFCCLILLRRNFLIKTTWKVIVQLQVFDVGSVLQIWYTPKKGMQFLGTCLIMMRSCHVCGERNRSQLSGNEMLNVSQWLIRERWW